MSQENPVIAIDNAGAESQVDPFIEIGNANPDEAYERVLPEAMALSPDSLAVINVDVMASVFTVIAALRRLAPRRIELESLPGFPKEYLAKLPDYVLGLYSAQSRYRFAVAPPEEIPVVLREATKWRDTLIADAKALVVRDLLKPDVLKGLTGVHGYRNVALDLAGLSTIFKGNWERIEGRVVLTREDLTTADRVALDLALAIARRERRPKQIARAGDIRRRIFTLLWTAYDSIRGGLSYLRWSQDDADAIAPSLYRGRVNRLARKGSKQRDQEPLQLDPSSVTARTVLYPVAAAEAANGGLGAQPTRPASPLRSTSVCSNGMR